MKMKHKKIIIWGTKADTGHTHLYVHGAMFRAAQHLGIETYWLDNRDNVDPEFFDDALVITEHHIATTIPISNNLPLRKSSTYIVHYLGNKNNHENHYLGKVGRLIDLRFRFNWSDKMWDYKFQKEKYTPLNQDNVSFIEFGKDCGQEHDNMYSLWATDLLPEEIDFENRFIPWNEPKYAFFTGTIRNVGSDNGLGDNIIPFQKFIVTCNKNNMPFVFHDTWKFQGLSTHDLMRETQKAFLAVEMRPPIHVSFGNVPCRNFKTISYGQLTMTNSRNVYEFFDREIAYHEDPEQLFYVASEMRQNPKSKNLILNQMRKVKDMHTYVHRMRDYISAGNL